MNAAILALVLGTLLAIGALAYVLYPIFFDASASPPAGASAVETLREAGGPSLAVTALREIEFDRATGKLSDSDYAQLKERYTREAVAAMREADRVSQATAGSTDEIEAAILAWRARHPACPSCGPRPEADAIFCSSCGRYLPGACARCGARIDEAGARFCRSCGHRLAA